MKPLRGKTIVEIIPDPNQTESGLYIHRKKDIPHRGKVISNGLPSLDNEGKEILLDLRPGDVIHFKRQWQDAKEKALLVIKHSDIIAKEVNGKLQALRDEVVVKRVFTGTVDQSSLIIIPDLDETKSNSMDFYGEVLSIGNKESMGVEVGMNIAYQRNEGLRCEIPNDRTEYFVLKPRAILAELV